MAEIVRRVDAERRLAELWMFPRCEPPSRDCRGDMTAEMSAHAMAMQGRHGKIDFTLLRRGDLLQELSTI